jgi:iron complex outermembrane receptor protein
MKKLIPLMLCVLTSTAIFAQNITGVIKDNEDKNLVNATVSLLRAKDSGVVKLAVSDKEGSFRFNNIKQGKYLLSAAYVGFNTRYSPVFEVTATDVDIPSLALAKKGGDLKDVTVSTRKQMVEVKADKTIFNVEGTINAIGQDVLELLRKAPGVQIDKDDNLSISGKNGVQVFIDGKPSPLAGKDLAEYLKSLQSAQVELIEIITNPSAKYEAAGNAGIINIRLKRDKTLGTNGSVNGGYGIGIYSKYNAGIALNHRDKKINLFGNYNYNRNMNESPFNGYRELLDSVYDQRNMFFNKNQNHNFKAGIDFILNKMNTLGFMVNGSRGLPRNNSFTNTLISDRSTKTVNKQLNASNYTTGHRQNTNYNVNYKYSNPAKGKDFNIDADYANYDIITDQTLKNTETNVSGSVVFSDKNNNIISPTKINIYSAKTDYEQNFQKGRLGIGGKTSFIRTDNDLQQYDVNGSAKSLDMGKSNRFKYKENINAGYINYNRQMKGWMFQVGVRLENTITEGNSAGFTDKVTPGVFVAYDSSFKRNYTNLFPSAALTFNKNPKNQWSFTYSRRIDRPAYQDLNPFEFKLDNYTYRKGNVDLRPQFTHSFGVTNVYRFKLTTGLTYSHTDDVFSPITEVYRKPNGERTTSSYLITRNLAQQDNVGLNISYPFQYKTYSLFFNLNSYYSHYKSNNGTGKNINLDVFSYRLFAQNSLKVSKTVTLELSGWYQGPSLWGATFKTKPMGQIDMGVQKSLFKGLGNIRFALSDVFKTFKIRADADYDQQIMRVRFSQESRVFRVNFSYRFGSSSVKAARNRKTAAEEENTRANGGGGGIGGN